MEAEREKSLSPLAMFKYLLTRQDDSTMCSGELASRIYIINWNFNNKVFM